MPPPPVTVRWSRPAVIAASCSPVVIAEFRVSIDVPFTWRSCDVSRRHVDNESDRRSRARPHARSRISSRITHALERLLQSSAATTLERRAASGGQRRWPVRRSKREPGFGDVLRRYRIAAGLTQEALAERAALSARGISDLERAARTHPYPATVRRLAEALGLLGSRSACARDSGRPVGSVRRWDIPSGNRERRDAANAAQQLRRSRACRSPQCVDLLAAHRLVTLLGPGGIGKTRLAIEVGRWDGRPVRGRRGLCRARQRS